MTDFALVASMTAYVCFTVSFYKANGKILPSLFAGFVCSLLIGSALHVGAYASLGTLGSGLLLGSLLAPVLSIDIASKSTFSRGNNVLVSRDALASLSMTIHSARTFASPVIPQSHAA